jgi:hypothetical protein
MGAGLDLNERFEPGVRSEFVPFSSLARERSEYCAPRATITPLITPTAAVESQLFRFLVQVADFIGGRTKTRTLDALIMSQRAYNGFGSK